MSTNVQSISFFTIFRSLTTNEILDIILRESDSNHLLLYLFIYLYIIYFYFYYFIYIIIYSKFQTISHYIIIYIINN